MELEIFISFPFIVTLVVIQSCLTLCESMASIPPGSSVCGILQARYWSEQPFLSPEDLPDSGVEPGSPALQAGSLLSEPSQKLHGEQYGGSLKN